MNEIRTQAGLIVAPDMLKHSMAEPSYEEKVKMYENFIMLMKQIESCEKAGFHIEHHPPLDTIGKLQVLLLSTDMVAAYTMWRNGVVPEAPTKEEAKPLIVTE